MCVSLEGVDFGAGSWHVAIGEAAFDESSVSTSPRERESRLSAVMGLPCLPAPGDRARAAVSVLTDKPSDDNNRRVGGYGRPFWSCRSK